MKCILCGRDVPELEHGNWDSGLVDGITAWYGSRHDCTRFLICLCDECLDTLPVAGEVSPFSMLLPDEESVLAYANSIYTHQPPVIGVVKAALRLVAGHRKLNARATAGKRWLRSARWWRRLLLTWSGYPW